MNLDFGSLIELQVPPDDDVNDIRKMWLKVPVIILSDYHQNLRDCDEGLGNVRLLEEISSEDKKMFMSHKNW